MLIHGKKNVADKQRIVYQQRSKIMDHFTFRGKKVYFGVDVHKKTYSFVAICGDVVVKKGSCPAKPAGFAKFLRDCFKGAQLYSAYEAGFCGFSLHRSLAELGINSIVVNPSSIRVAANDKVKTDARDARKLAEQLKSGLLSGIHVPTPEEEQRRELSRTRQQLVRDRTAKAAQIKSKLDYHGIACQFTSTPVSVASIKKLMKKKISPDLDYVIGKLCQMWLAIHREIKDIEAKLKADQSIAKTVAIYQSVPGIGRISSHTLTHELGDMSRFDSAKKLFNYCGLTPSEYSSGEKVRRGSITKQGNPRVRQIMVEVAWTAIKSDEELKKKFARLARKKEARRAIVAIARIMLGRIRACLIKRQAWKTMPVEAG